ncbi:MAG: ATPase [Epulopiscium sp.]|nr:ATPase [Candidatus Epulonipiscium sp.]
MDNVLELLDALEDILDDSSTMPFTNKVMIDKEEFIEIITDIRLKLPNELKQSKWVMEERTQILINAQKEAENHLQEAETKLNQLINEHEITKKAYEQAEEITETAKQHAREMRLGAMEYADEILANVEEALVGLMEQVNQQFSAFEQYIQQNINIIHQNRQELRGNKK